MAPVDRFWRRVGGILPLFLALATAHAATTPNLNVIVSGETAPPGATVQIKLSLERPAAVSSGELALDLDPAGFGPVTAIATFSAVGDAPTCKINSHATNLRHRASSPGWYFPVNPCPLLAHKALAFGFL